MLHFADQPVRGDHLSSTYTCAGQLVALMWELQSLGLISQREAQCLRVPGSRTAWTKLLRELEAILEFYEQSRSPAVTAKRHVESERARLLTQLLGFTTMALP